MPVKVLRADTTRMPLDSAGDAEQAERVQVASRIEAFMSCSTADTDKLGEDQVDLLPNRHWLLSLDNALVVSFGFGLSRFLPPDGQSLLPRAGDVIERVRVPEAEEIEGVGRMRAFRTDPHGERSAILKRTVVDGRVWRPSLHKAQDQGSL
eukprot:3152496-Amphidinium_carterae.1